MNMKTLTETSTFRVLSLLLCFCFFIPAMNVSASSLQADKFKVSGIVKDATGEPVIGASVVEKGTTNGTVTDLDGNFNLSVASNSTIVISFIGYSDQEFHISKDNMVLNVNLKEDTEMIDEVVVVGYGVQKKENLTGSVAAVNFKDVASMPVANTANMLQGRLPGVMLTNNGAQAGHDSPEIRIRGVGTFEHNDPMVLIDGVESSVSQIAEINWSGWMEGYDMAMGIHTPNSSIIGSYWKDCYEVISRCNVLIANIDRVDMDASQKAIYQAEAKTIRALMYINLTMTYQDVPFLTAPLTIDEAECEKTDRAAIVAHIMTDLQDAAEVLPQNASSRGHITKGAALSLLGRVALYNEKWDDAIAAYKQVQGLGYSLDPSYAKLFTQSGETSPEIIFAVRYEGPGMSGGAAFNAHWNTPLEAMNGTIDLADAYYCKDGKPTTDTKIAELNNEGGLDVSKPNPAHFENRDPRLYSTLFVPGMLWNGKGGIDTSASNPYVNVYGGAAASLSTIYVYKYFDPTDTSNSWDNGQDFYVVRYAEVLLSLAEAMVQKGGYAYSDVTALVNEVRQRADVNMPTVEEVEGTSLSKDELLEVIKHERRVELAFEGLRLFDLYRWKELDKAVANIENERTMYGLAYEARKFNGERDYVWPLPTAELDTNKKLVQHDLWK